MVENSALQPLRPINLMFINIFWGYLLLTTLSMFCRDVQDDFYTTAFFNAVSHISNLHKKLKNIFSYKVTITIVTYKNYTIGIIWGQYKFIIFTSRI